MEEIDLAYKDALNGVPSKRPLIEMTIPSVLDKTISPPGMSFFYRFNTIYILLLMQCMVLKFLLELL